MTAMSTPAPDAIRDAYQQLGPALLAYARSLVGEAGTAEDVLQQVFAGLLARGTLPAEPRPYLFRCVRNACLNHRRAARREDGALPPLLAAAPGREEERADLERALVALPEAQRQVVLLRVWGQLTFQEIADLGEVPLSTVASRWRYALDHLRARLGIGGGVRHG
jgi:RNA polymerase sigma-70 factor (ECF subfamily)